MAQLKKKDILYYARILPYARIYEICELRIRTIEETWFVGVDKRDKHAYLFTYKDIGTLLFYDRDVALEKVLEAEKNAPKIESETDLEEY